MVYVCNCFLCSFTGLRDENMNINSMITTVTDAASEILRKERRRKKAWVTRDVLSLSSLPQLGTLIQKKR